MANQNKTSVTEQSPFEFIDTTVDDAEKRNDSIVLIDMMKKITNHEPKMWGPTMIGFGDWHYVSPTGREGDWFSMGFSPRKAAFSLYVTMDAQAYPNIMNRLGKYKTGKGCIYVKRLSDIDLLVLEELTRVAYEDLKKEYVVK